MNVMDAVTRARFLRRSLLSVTDEIEDIRNSLKQHRTLGLKILAREVVTLWVHGS